MPPPTTSLVPNQRSKKIWVPSLSVAFRLLLLARFCAAMYSNIQDCDEVYNYWEPLHYLQFGSGFQTWETSPEFAIRSWAYILLHYPISVSVRFLAGDDKRRAFLAVRIALATFSSFCEAKYYRSVVEQLNERIGRYMLFLLLLSPGMWIASPALLPSSFSMYFTMLALASSMRPASQLGYMRTLYAVVFFAASAIVGWPFALLLSVPFVYEELFVWGGDRVPVNKRTNWAFGRWRRFALSTLIASFVLVPVVYVDTLAYGKFTIVPLNIIKYNVFSAAGRGPELYGTEPWFFYLKNLALNFNIVLPLALLSLPALALTHTIDYRRLSFVKHQADETSPYTLLAIRLAPFYLWLWVLSQQPHKEERFMYPAYPLLVFNGATTIFLLRGWTETTYAKVVSIYAASRSKLFSRLTLLIVASSMILGGMRIGALQAYYHAPIEVSSHFAYEEIPRILNATGLLPPRRPKPENNSAFADETLDISELPQLGLRVCYAKEWYRFPSHYQFPNGIEVQFVKSAFGGHLPGKFVESKERSPGLWWREETSVVPKGLNDMNRENPDVYVDVSTCDYLVDLDLPLHSASASVHEPRYATQTETWSRIFCAPFLDAANSPLLSRTLYTGIKSVQAQNNFGDYCLLGNRQRLAALEGKKWTRGKA